MGHSHHQSWRLGKVELGRNVMQFQFCILLFAGLNNHTSLNFSDAQFSHYDEKIWVTSNLAA